MRTIQATLLVASSLLLSQVLCLADNAPAATTDQKADHQTQYQTLRAKLFSDCDNVDKALKEAGPTLTQLNSEFSTAHKLESDYAHSKDTNASEHDLNQLAAQYANHVPTILTLETDYYNQLDASVESFKADEPKLYQFADLAKDDQPLLKRLSGTYIAFMSPVWQTSATAKAVVAVEMLELANEGISPNSLDEQAQAANLQCAAQILLDEKTVERSIPELNATNFDSTITNSKIPILVCFTTSWSQYCRKFVPEIIQAMKQYQGKITIVRVDVDLNPDLADRCQVQGLPTIVLFVPGQDPSKQDGLLEYSELTAFLDGALPANPATK